MTGSWILRDYRCPYCAHVKLSHQTETDIIDMHSNWRILIVKIELICLRCEAIAHSLFDHISIY